MGTKQIQELLDRGLEFSDDFTDSRAPGAVVGSLSASGHRRLGVDVEEVLSIDNTALRIAPLIEAGFNRAVLAYGPFTRRPGLAFAVYMLNGHNTAQAEPLPDTFWKRFDYWLKGSETDSPRERLVQWLLSGRVRRTWRQFRRWKRTAKDGRPVPLLDENLAVGWFPSDTILDPRLKGNGFIMHALGPENGELWVGGTTNRTRSLRGIQNVPIYYVSIARGEGTVYYVSSMEGTVGLPAYPSLRPVAVDQERLPDDLYVGIHQSVLGQIGWRLDTRVYGVRLAHVSGYDSWCGGAHAADNLITEGVRAGAPAEKGGNWHVSVRRSSGSNSDPSLETEKLATLDPGAQSGLVHASVSIIDVSPGRAGLLWRFLDEQNHWRLELSARACEIVLVAGGSREILASREFPCSSLSLRRLQILDDGTRLMAYVDGEPVANRWITDARLQEATKVGILLTGAQRSEAAIRSFEVHPRQVRLPGALDMGMLSLRKGTQEVIVDDFSGAPGNLQGRMTSISGTAWHRVIGTGVFHVTGERAVRVLGCVSNPCPGRTAYCIDWPHPDFVDLEVMITPPGMETGQKHMTTAGFIIYQDPTHYIVLNLWRSDAYSGGSVSTFFRFGRFEDVYDAVWTNVGDRIFHGKELVLRLCCDGEQYVASIDGEAVLYRAVRDVYPDVERLKIRKVGLLANWEFGKDTGSTFRQFKARV